MANNQGRMLTAPPTHKEIQVRASMIASFQLVRMAVLVRVLLL